VLVLVRAAGAANNKILASRSPDLFVKKSLARARARARARAGTINFFLPAFLPSCYLALVLVQAALARKLLMWAA